jgi:putative transposase
MRYCNGTTFRGSLIRIWLGKVEAGALDDDLQVADVLQDYGYRRVGAALRHKGIVVNSKKLRRLMREQGLQPKRRRRYVVTTGSDDVGPILPDLAKGLVPGRPNQLRVADLTYVAIPGAFVYLARPSWMPGRARWSVMRSVGPCARIAVAALKAAIRNRLPSPGCIHHSVAVRNMRRRCIDSCWPLMAWQAR